MTKPPVSSYDRITGGNVVDLSWLSNQAFTINTHSRPLGELLFAVPVFHLLCNNHRALKITRHFVRHVAVRHESCRITSRNIYMLGLVTLANLLRKRAGQRRLFPGATWNPRRSLELMGITGGLKRQALTIAGTLVGSFSSPPFYSGEPVGMTYYSPSSGVFANHCSFYDVQYNARRLLPYVGSYFRRDQPSLGRFGSCYLDEVVVTDTLVTFRMSKCFYQSYPSNRTMEAMGNVVVSVRLLAKDQPFDIVVDVNLPKDIKFDGVVANFSIWERHARGLQYVSIASAYDNAVLIGGQTYADNQRYRSTGYTGPIGGLLAAFDKNLWVYSPGLFHSQGKALNNIMIDYGSNFENLIQSAQFIELIESVALKAPQTFADIFTDMNARSALGRIQMLTQLLSGAQLAYEFGVAPTIRALQKLTEELCSFTHSEASFKLEGYDFSSQDEYLKRAVLQGSPSYLGLSSSEVIWYSIAFRTECRSTLSAAHAAKAILMNDPIAMIHGYPTPSSIWESLSGSFAIDWVANVGPMIKDQQAYWLSPSVPLRIGHTVHSRFIYSDGRIFNNFWRSFESSIPIDPPGVSWLPFSGLPPISIPYGLQQLFRLTGRL